MPADPSASWHALQRAAGNEALARLVSQTTVQRNGGKAPRKAKVEAKARLEGVRASPRSARLRARLQREAPTIPVPVVGPHGESFWDGSRARLHFSAATYNSVLAAKGNPIAGIDGITRYECATCHGYFARKKDAPDEKNIDLDHVTDWNTYVDLQIDERAFRHDGHRWYAFFLEDALAAYNDARNLVPKCETHNRSKGGPKFIDKVVKLRHRADDCPACEGD